MRTMDNNLHKPTWQRAALVLSSCLAWAFITIIPPGKTWICPCEPGRGFITRGRYPDPARPYADRNHIMRLELVYPDRRRPWRSNRVPDPQRFRSSKINQFWRVATRYSSRWGLQRFSLCACTWQHHLVRSDRKLIKDTYSANYTIHYNRWSKLGQG